ncbi:hypothetical protein [Methylobacterium sp. 88A]|uniref:hypothetical protein n=1 Tax=Methylobacterium sp. 88A TaxID=1131813 RepID=UPI0003683113|nr:hypothetical protein [Methylobacterium sp. 88A]
MMAAIPELMPRARTWRYAVSWVKDWTPILLEEHDEEFIRDRWTKVANRECPNLTTDQLSKLLAVADYEPLRFGLCCIPAASRTDKIRAADRKAKRRLADAARHAAAGHTPRSESLQAKEPWKAAGVSRSTWFANRKAERLAPLVEAEIPVLDSFAATVSVVPSWTDLRPSDPLPSLQPTSGQEEPQDVAPANDNPPPVTEVGYRGRVLDLPPEKIDHILFMHPALRQRLPDHLDTIDRAMRRTTTPYYKVVLRNLLQDEARRAQRMNRLAA